jgi:hypothetical protein
MRAAPHRGSLAGYQTVPRVDVPTDVKELVDESEPAVSRCTLKKARAILR